MSKTTPLTINNIKVWTYSPTDEATDQSVNYDLFDERTDFLANKDIAGVAALVSVANPQGGDDEENPRGLRRTLTLSLVDLTAGTIIAAKEAKVNIPKFYTARLVRVDFPLNYDEIKENHTYKIVVTETAANRFVKEKTFNLFKESTIGADPAKWYNTSEAYIENDYNYEPYRTLKADPDSKIEVCFKLNRHFQEPLAIVPELELRLYTPDGKIDSKIMRPEVVDLALGWEIYKVSLTKLLDADNRGVSYAELLCFEHPIAGMVFSTNDTNDYGKWTENDLMPLETYSLEAATSRLKMAIDFDRLLDDFISSQTLSTEETDEDDDNDDTDDNNNTDDEIDNKPLLSPLDNLTGLAAVKAKLLSYEKLVRFNKMRSDLGLLATPTPLHAMFLGSPGTGKTTVAKLMGDMLRRAGVLSSGHVVVRERSTLMGPYYSDEQTKTLEALEQAEGGILFIDEAYQLYQPDDPRDPGKFVIEALLTALADDKRRNWMLIMAGYPDKMRQMFEMNPGLKSRIPESNIYQFDDFSEPELFEIAERYLAQKEFQLSSDACDALRKRISADYAQRDKTFGNARHIMNLIQTSIIPAMATRVASNAGNIDRIALTEIQACDIELPSQKIATPGHRRIGFTA